MGAPSGLHPLRKSVPSGFLARKDVADDPNAERTRKRGALGGVKAGGESEREGGGAGVVVGGVCTLSVVRRPQSPILFLSSLFTCSLPVSFSSSLTACSRGCRP